MPMVLIVDDQPAVRTALEVLFEVHDVESVSAKGPREALARIAEGGIAVVVQDMNFAENTTSACGIGATPLVKMFALVSGRLMWNEPS